MPEVRWRWDLSGIWALGVFALGALAGWSGDLGLWMSFSAFLAGAMVELPGLRETGGLTRDSGRGSLAALCLLVGMDAWVRASRILPPWMSSLHPARTVAGGSILALAMFLRWRARRDLSGGFRYSIHLESGQKLITTGLYARLRHPAYLGAHLFLAAVPLAGGSLLGAVASLLSLPATYARIRREETMLEASFGDEFRTWRRHTPGLLLPRAWRPSRISGRTGADR